MATFYGGEQLTRVIDITTSQSSASGEVTLYTCPSGHYAEVEIIAAAGSWSQGVIKTINTSTPINTTSIVIENAGSFISNGTASGEVKAQITNDWLVTILGTLAGDKTPILSVESGYRLTVESQAISGGTFQVRIKEYKLP